MAYTEDPFPFPMQQLHPRAVWLFFVRSFFVFFIIFVWLDFMLAGVVLSAAEEAGYPVTLPMLAGWGIAGLLVFLVLAYVWARLSYHFYRYELRPEGFRKELGVIWKKYVTIPYGKIQNVDIHRGVFARLLGLSDVNIQTVGATSAGGRSAWAEGVLPGLSIADAEALRDELVKRAEKGRGGV